MTEQPTPTPVYIRRLARPTQKPRPGPVSISKAGRIGCPFDEVPVALRRKTYYKVAQWIRDRRVINPVLFPVNSPTLTVVNLYQELEYTCPVCQGRSMTNLELFRRGSRRVHSKHPLLCYPCVKHYFQGLPARDQPTTYARIDLALARLRLIRASQGCEFPLKGCIPVPERMAPPQHVGSVPKASEMV